MFDPRWFYMGLNYGRVVKYLSDKFSYSYSYKKKKYESDLIYIPKSYSNRPRSYSSKSENKEDKKENRFEIPTESWIAEKGLIGLIFWLVIIFSFCSFIYVLAKNA